MLSLLASVALSGPLLHEDFEDPNALDAWTLERGASTSDGPRSEVALDGGALRLRADQTTTWFHTVNRPVAVDGVDWVKVSARMRTEDVDPSTARFKNCDVYVRTGSGIGVLDIVTGTTPWTDQARIFRVPNGLKVLDVGAMLSMPGTAWVDDVTVEAVEPGWTTVSEGGFTWHVLPGDAVSDAQRRRTLAAWSKAAAWLEVSPEGSVDYWKYPDRETKRLYTGNVGNAHAVAKGREVHTLWPSDDHEIVHLLAAQRGSPPPLLSEGLAVHFGGDWQGDPLEAHAAGLVERGAWISLPQLATWGGFREADDLLTYAEAGAFVRWVEQTHGTEALLAVYGALPWNASAEDVDRVLNERLGMDLAAADRAVRAWLTEEKAE